jgi:CTP synthase
MVERIKTLSSTVTIGLVGKYVQLHDAYLSVAEALHHAGYACGAQVEIKWIDSETITDENVETVLAGCDGLIVPGGFGDRGVAGMIVTAQWARENDVPYFGICLGMQVAVIEFARSVCGWREANSGEFDPASPYKVIDFLPGQFEGKDKGGTLRLGSYPCKLAEGTVIREEYGCTDISERHRHRYEFNNEYRETLQQKGLVLSGTSPDGYIVETVETGKGYFVGVQFHPEFRSRPDRPHPLFKGLIRNSIERKGGIS